MIIVLLAWNLMIIYSHILLGNTITHYLWVLHFMEVRLEQDYKSAVEESSDKFIDSKTRRTYLWPIIYAISFFEQYMERELIVLFPCHINFLYIIHI